MQVGESVVNAIVEYHAQGSEEAHAEENRMFLRYLRELTGKRWWQVHRKPPETRLIYFTHMHGYSHHRIAGDFGREKGP
ncbi:hypothetical protein ACSLOY_28595, partial [Klebsiella pneumoniae]